MNFISSCRIGHENFELLNHDIVEPVLLEGKLVRNLSQATLNWFLRLAWDLLIIFAQ